MASDGETHAVGFLQLATACSTCDTEEDFVSIIRLLVKPLFPHMALLAAIGRIDIQQIEVHRIIGGRPPRCPPRTTRAPYGNAGPTRHRSLAQDRTPPGVEVAG